MHGLFPLQLLCISQQCVWPLLWGRWGWEMEPRGKLRTVGVFDISEQTYGPYRARLHELMQPWKLMTMRRCLSRPQLELPFCHHLCQGPEVAWFPVEQTPNGNGSSSENSGAAPSNLRRMETTSQRNSRGKRCHRCVRVRGDLQVKVFFSPHFVSFFVFGFLFPFRVRFVEWEWKFPSSTHTS